ncbi:hypothetical protein F2P79_003525 [Pimephales promelas]|nr:hypothetical protein F2P79_003525 [Pimephales promelas]
MAVVSMRPALKDELVWVQAQSKILPEKILLLGELPGILASLKEALESMKRGSFSSSPRSSELCLPETSEMISLSGSDVPKRVYGRLNKSQTSLFTHDLATLLFAIAFHFV